MKKPFREDPLETAEELKIKAQAAEPAAGELASVQDLSGNDHAFPSINPLGGSSGRQQVENGSDHLEAELEETSFPQQESPGAFCGVRTAPAFVSKVAKQSWPQSAFAFLAVFICSTILVLGQMFMVADVAVVCGNISSALFGLSFDRIMYHCGPQDTYLSGFVLAAIPLFWTAWYLRKRRVLKLIFLSTLGLGAAVVCGFAVAPSGFSWLLISLLTLAVFALIQHAGSALSTYQSNWPRTFSATKILLICYIPALFILGYEFSLLDLNGTVEQVTDESMLSSLGIIAAFAFLPAIFTSIEARTKRFLSGLGLSALGQLPILSCALIYFLANGIMLASVHLLGASKLADYFALQAGALFPPDFDLSATNNAELLSKFVSSLFVLALLSTSICAGSSLGILWNRWRDKDKQ